MLAQAESASSGQRSWTITFSCESSLPACWVGRLTRTNETTSPRRGMTLVEVLIVIVIMSIISAVVLTQHFANLEDTKVTMARYNLSRLRSILQLYVAHHDTSPSATLVELVASTKESGEIGTGPQYRYGPYLADIPTNPLTNSNLVKAIVISPATPADVTGQGGWLYHAETGSVWIDHLDYYTE